MAPSFNRRMLKLLRLLAVVAIAGVGAATVLRWPTLQKAHLAERWREDLEAADEADMPAAAERLLDLGDEGIAALARSLASPRHEVADAAATALGNRLSAWELANDDAASELTAALARALSETVDDCPVAARGDAAQLAHRLLLLPIAGDSATRLAYIAACERVLLAAENDPQPAARLAESGRRVAPRADSEADVAAMANLPGGNVPHVESQPPALPAIEPVPREKLPAEIGPTEPRLLLDGNALEAPEVAIPN